MRFVCQRGGESAAGVELPVERVSGRADRRASQLYNQLRGVLFTMALAGIGTFVILKVVNAILPLRVDEEEEDQGLDLTQHGEQAYND